ncbi:Ribonuclease VapC32 [Gammaproteobacteria bacterium]|nr:Ribonuclease VapC32 [Gammaproteobacteria bacterium]
MILVDTSIWIDHLRAAGGPLTSMLQTHRVYIHPWVIGELACGNLGNRQEVLGLLRSLPYLAPAREGEVLHFIEQHRLMGRGIGYIDAHLLAATATHAAQIWTRDKRLNGIAQDLGLAYVPGTH